MDKKYETMNPTVCIAEDIWIGWVILESKENIPDTVMESSIIETEIYSYCSPRAYMNNWDGKRMSRIEIPHWGENNFLYLEKFRCRKNCAVIIPRDFTNSLLKYPKELIEFGKIIKHNNLCIITASEVAGKWMV